MNIEKGTGQVALGGRVQQELKLDALSPVLSKISYLPAKI